MKVKLIASNKDCFIGYKNITTEELKDIYDNSLFELYIDAAVIKSIPNREFIEFINLCCSKIRYSGQIIISGPDIGVINLLYVNRSIDEKYLSDVISDSKGFYNCKIVSTQLLNNKFKVESMSINDNHFIVRAKRG